MATGGDLATIVLDIVQDPSLEEDDVLDLFNQCVGKVTQRFVLPILDTTGTITTVTTDWRVSAPVNFQRNLHAAFDDTGRPLTIYNNFGSLSLDYNGSLSTAGVRVDGVAASGKHIAYAPIPVAAQQLTLRYQRIPDTIADSTTIELFPAVAVGDQDDLLINYACWKLFSKIEQGMEGAKVDTSYYMALYTGLLDEVGFLLQREGANLPPPPIARMERW